MPDNGNGKQEEPKNTINQEKAEKELASHERLKRFTEHPESFVELSEVIIMAVKNPQSQLGLSVFVGNCRRQELDIGVAELQHIVHKVMINMDIQSEMAHQKPVIQKPGFLQGVNRILRR